MQQGMFHYILVVAYLLAMVGLWFFVRVTDRIVKVKFHFCDKRFGTYFEGSACATWTTDKLYPIILVIVFLLLTGTMMHKFYNIVKKKENETEKENKEPI